MAVSINDLKLKLDIPTSDTSEDTLLTMLIEQAEDAVMKYYYGAADLPSDIEFDDRFKFQALDIAVYLYNKMGIEGQNSHIEQGIERHYDSSGIPEALFNGIPKKCKVLF